MLYLLLFLVITCVLLFVDIPDLSWMVGKELIGI